MKIRNHLLAAVCVLAGALATRAATFVSLDTSGLIGHSAGPFYIDFQFNDGTGANDNVVNITNINFGGGSAIGPAALFGGASGDLLTGITLTDSDAFNEFYQAFIPGAVFSFHLTMTNVYTGLVPDVFGFTILDSNLFNLGTYAPGSDQFLIATLDGPSPTIELFASVDGSVPAPHVPDTGSTLALILVAGTSLVLGHRMTRRHSAA